MANAETNIKTVQVLEGINLTLSFREAAALMALLYWTTAGHPNTTLRGETDSILNALKALGFVGSDLNNLVKGTASFIDLTPELEAKLTDIEQRITSSPTNDLTKIQSYEIDAALQNNDRIKAIKILRDLTAKMVDGEKVCIGLREAKDEIDRRYALLGQRKYFA